MDKQIERLKAAMNVYNAAVNAGYVHNDDNAADRANDARANAFVAALSAVKVTRDAAVWLLSELMQGRLT